MIVFSDEHEMHFFYIDETGCSGTDLNANQEPIFVLGGISVKDQGWVATTSAMQKIIQSYFAPHQAPTGFELHAHELLNGPFYKHDRSRRNKLAFELLGLLEERSHHTHFIAIEKSLLDEHAKGDEHTKFNTRTPYLLGFDYLTTSINKHVKDRLGHTARGIIIMNEKEMFDDDIAEITRFRRFQVSKTHRIKWLVEFSYSIDSQKHPMIQLSDLVIYCAKKFLELDRGYRDYWPQSAKIFYAKCFEILYSRVPKKSLVKQDGKHAVSVNELLAKTVAKPRHNWKARHLA